jgi:hypothetical protein
MNDIAKSTAPSVDTRARPLSPYQETKRNQKDGLAKKKPSLLIDVAFSSLVLLLTMFTK